MAHVAAEMGISRATASKWINRYRQFGEIGLIDRSSTPLRQPRATESSIVATIEWLRREPQRIVAERPGHMVHVDVKKVGRIPDGGGWRVHGRDSPEARAVERTKKRGTRRGYNYLHSAIDGHTRVAYTEALDDEKGAAAAGFLDRAKAWFAAHTTDNHQHR